MSAPESRILRWEGRTFPEGIDWARFDCAVLESAPETRIVLLRDGEKVTPESYDSGVLFGADVEARWRRRRSGRIHVVVIEDGPTRGWPEGSIGADLRTVAAEEEGLPEQVLLWGEPRGGSGAAEWYESRIPDVLRQYPKQLAGQRVAVAMAHYRLETEAPLPGGGTERRETVISRCQRLVAAAKVEEA